jgi:hypothetical protein
MPWWRERCSELRGKRRVMRRRQDLDETAPHHRQAVRRSRWPQCARRVGVLLQIDRRDIEAEPLELLAGGLQIMHEEADVVEEHLLADRQLPVGPRLCRHGWAHSTLAPEARTIAAHFGISDRR